MSAPLPFPPPSRRLRLGFVGGGGGAFIGAIHAGGARLSGRWDVVAGALSSTPEKSRASGRDWFLAEDRIHDDYVQMARAEAAREDGIDAVAIVTPNHMHEPAAMAFLDAGIDVICDKPLAPDLAGAMRMAERAESSGLIFGVTYPYAAYSMVRQARAMVRDGRLGEIRQIHVEYFQEFGARMIAENGGVLPWRLDPDRAGPSWTVADIGTHAVHLASFVSGLPLARVRADLHVTGEPKPLEDTGLIQARFGEVPGTIMVSQTAVGTQCGLRLRIFGTEAALDWCQETGDVLQFTPYDSPTQTLSSGYAGGLGDQARRLTMMPRGCPEGIMEAWANLYTEFAVAIDARRSGTPLPGGLLEYADARTAARGLAFVDAALASQASGGWEPVASIDRQGTRE